MSKFGGGAAGNLNSGMVLEGVLAGLREFVMGGVVGDGVGPVILPNRSGGYDA